jgi:hypothetical protein
MPRMRARTSMLGPRLAPGAGPAAATGHAVRSNKCNSDSGMKRVREA